jgi:hypothetical protein
MLTIKPGTTAGARDPSGTGSPGGSWATCLCGHALAETVLDVDESGEDARLVLHSVSCSTAVR